MVEAQRPQAPAPVIGLVLSSGAARGAAHVGVLQALEELGLDIPVVVGTSAGALIGAAWSAGFSADAIARRVTGATLADFGTARPALRLGLLETTVLRAQLDAVFDGRPVEELPRRFGAVATDLTTRRAVLLDHGSVTDAVSASMAVPGIFPPVHLGGRTLVDGVLTSPVPVWAARRLGATMTISVSLRAPAAPTLRRGFQARVFAPADAVRADVELVVDTRGASSWSSRDARLLIDRGRRVAFEALRSADLAA